MKIINLNCLIVLLLTPALMLAGDGCKGKYTKEKRISKAYIVNPNAGLDVVNKYGTVYVTTWDEDKTSIDVVIKVSADKTELVDKRINSINVDFEATKELVSARTKIGNFSGRVNMEINYTIKIPKKGAIKLNNQYGGIRLGEINGKSDISCKYGELAITSLNNESNVINIEYCGGSTAGYIKNGALTAKYSDMKIADVGKLTVTSEYTNIKATSVDDLTYKSKYGEITVDRASKVTGTSNYLTTRFGSISNLLNVTVNYGGISINSIEKTVKNITIYASYTGVNITYPDSYPFDFEFFLKFGGLNGAQGLKFEEKQEKHTEAYYKGYNKSNGINRIFIKSEFGSINLHKS